MRLDFYTVKKMCKFIMACCVLHNICITQNDLFIPADNDNENEDLNPVNNATGAINYQENTTRGNLLKRLGEMKRNTIVDSFL